MSDTGKAIPFIRWLDNPDAWEFPEALKAEGEVEGGEEEEDASETHP